MNQPEYYATAAAVSPGLFMRSLHQCVVGFEHGVMITPGCGRYIHGALKCEMAFPATPTANENGLPEGKPLNCLVAGEGFEPSTFGL